MLCNDLEEWDGGRVGARLKWEEIYVYLLLIQQKPTQHCKAIILQLKTWKKNRERMNMLLMLTVNYFLLLNHTWSQRKKWRTIFDYGQWKMSTKPWRMLQTLSEEKESTRYDFLPSFQVPSHSIWNVKNISYIERWNEMIVKCPWRVSLKEKKRLL